MLFGDNEEGLSEEEYNDEIALNENYTFINLSPTDMPKETFVAETSFGYNLKNDKNTYFISTKGEDYINKDKDQKFSFLLKIPY